MVQGRTEEDVSQLMIWQQVLNSSQPACFRSRSYFYTCASSSGGGGRQLGFFTRTGFTPSMAMCRQLAGNSNDGQGKHSRVLVEYGAGRQSRLGKRVVL